MTGLPPVGAVDSMSLNDGEEENSSTQEPNVERKLTANVEEEVRRRRSRVFLDLFLFFLGFVHAHGLIFIGVG